ncbi:hypothetical protein Emag_000224 [Eimeria magna]
MAPGPTATAAAAAADIAAAAAGAASDGSGSKGGCWGSQQNRPDFSSTASSREAISRDDEDALQPYNRASSSNPEDRG